MPMTIEQWRALRAMNSQPVAVGTEGSASVVVKKGDGTETVTLKYILEMPVELARKAQAVFDWVTVEIYSLARVMASEGYSGKDYTLAMTLIGHVTLRVAKARNINATYPITTLLTYCNYSAVRWHYGQQSGRYASTMRPPTKWHLMLAKAIIDGEVPDMTHGSVKYLDPWGPGALQAGRKLRPFPEVMAKWKNEGLAWRGSIPGIEDIAFAMFYPEPDAAKREFAFNTLMGIWRANFGGQKEPSSEGDPRKPSGSGNNA